MRLGIAAGEMEGSKTGVGRFVEGLLTGLSECDFDGRVLLFFRGEPFEHALWSDSRFEPVFARESRLSLTMWEQRRLPALLPALDVFFGPAYSLPGRLPCPGVVMIHDLSFEVLPLEFRFRERWRRRWLARRAARRAARVLTVSEAVAADLERRYRVERARIGVLRHGIDTAFFHPRSVEGSGPEEASGPVAEPYLLFLGTVLPRRRLDLLLDAFAVVAADRPDLRLALAGPNRLPMPGDLERWIWERDLEARVVQLGWVPEADLPELLARAELSYYLSTYEGFGLPPLESLACGTPAVVSRGLALDDLWPDYPYRCEELDRERVVEVTRRALEDLAERAEVARRGRELAESLTWKACAESFLAEIDEALHP